MVSKTFQKRTRDTASSSNFLSIAELVSSAKLESERVSSVSTGWRVQWTALECARDIWQNFVDANRSRLCDIEVKASGDSTEICAPATMDLDHCYYLGSTKSPENGDIGFFGEGLKVACLVLLRDFGVRLAIVSEDRAVEIAIDETTNTIGLRPLVYRFYQLKQRQFGTRMIIERTNDELQSSFVNAHLNFFSADHPWLGDRIAGDMESVFVAKTKVGCPGAIFYRRMKRADLSLPLILAINSPYKSIDALTQRDRDRNAFGEKLLTTFYRTIASSGVLNNLRSLEVLLRQSKSFWEQGHPLLARLLDRLSNSSEPIFDLFGDRYYSAEQHRHSMDYATMVPLMDIESAWKQAGRMKLPHYFRGVGVRSPLDEYELRQRLAREEAEEKLNATRRGPTAAEQACVQLLEEVLRDFDQSLATVVLRGVNYLIADTDDLLGAWQRSRQYNSREIYLAAELFDGPFRTAFATHLHECSHLFGRDGSRGFTDALTQLIEAIAQRPSRIKVYANRWSKLRVAVRRERAAKISSNDSLIKIDSPPDAEFAVELLSAMPMSEAQVAISRYLSQRRDVIASLLQAPKSLATPLSSDAATVEGIPF